MSLGHDQRLAAMSSFGLRTNKEDEETDDQPNGDSCASTEVES